MTAKKKVVKKKLGPPGGKVPSNPTFCFRLSAAERREFEEAAAVDGYKSLSTWVKWLCRRRSEYLRER